MAFVENLIFFVTMQKIVKIGSHLTKLSPIMLCPVFMDHSVVDLL